MRRVLSWALAWTVYLGPVFALAQADGAVPEGKAADPRCQALQSAATANELPLEFLTRLIWQESRFDDFAISRAGARGIAQFMPATANEMNLANPFDAVTAIEKSAQLLRGLQNQFGNLGLAAAAYNAGPKRVSDWLLGHRPLPQETVQYVRIITGHSPDEWRNQEPSATNLDLPIAVPCPEIVRLFAVAPGTTGRQAAKSINAEPPPRPAWGVQLIGNASQSAALAAFYKLQTTYQSVLGSREPLVLRSSAGRNGTWYRVRIGADTRADAERLCSNLRAVGGSCLVQVN